MLNSNRRRVISVFLVVLATLLLHGTAYSQELNPGTKNLAWAQEFLGVFYPDLKNHEYVITATTSHPFDVSDTSMGNLSIQVGEMAPGTILGIGSKTGPIYAKQFVAASFTFDRGGRLDSFASEGSAVGKQQEYEKAKELVGFHPEWTDAEISAALLKAGAAYGPGDKTRLLDTIPIDRLEKLLGKITVISTKFEAVTDSDQRLPLLWWVVTLTVNVTGGVKSTYQLHFEPFRGALIGMHSIPSPAN